MILRKCSDSCAIYEANNVAIFPLSEKFVNNIEQPEKYGPHKHKITKALVPSIRRGWHSCESQCPRRGWRKRWKEEKGRRKKKLSFSRYKYNFETKFSLTFFSCHGHTSWLDIKSSSTSSDQQNCWVEGGKFRFLIYKKI